MTTITVSRPTKRSCSWLVQDDVPSRLSPLFLYDSSVSSSILDENGLSADNAAFSGKVRTWRDLSGNDRHITFQGNATSDDDIFYQAQTTQYFPIDSSVIAISSNRTFPTGEVRRLELDLNPVIENQDFECFLVGGFTNENPQDYSSLFSSGSYGANNRFSEGAFQLSSLQGYFQILVADSNGASQWIQLSAFEAGVKTFHLKYNAGEKILESRVNGNLVNTTENIVINFQQFKMFSNRAEAQSTGTEIRSLAVFGQLLSSENSKNYGLYQNCKWEAKAGEIVQAGGTDFDGVQQFTNSWSFAAQRIDSANYDRRISVLRVTVQPTLFGQNITARLYLGTGNTPTGISLVTGAGGGIGEGFTNNTSLEAQVVNFGTYNSSTSSVDDFIAESAIIPAGQTAWIAITSQTPFGIGYQNSFVSTGAIYEETGHDSNAAPHNRGDAWVEAEDRRYSFEIATMRIS